MTPGTNFAQRNLFLLIPDPGIHVIDPSLLFLLLPLSRNPDIINYPLPPLLLLLLFSDDSAADELWTSPGGASRRKVERRANEQNQVRDRPTRNLKTIRAEKERLVHYLQGTLHSLQHDLTVLEAELADVDIRWQHAEYVKTFLDKVRADASSDK